MQTMNTIAEEPDYRPITLLDKWKFVKQAIADKRLTAGDLRCVVAIADCYNSGQRRAWPSYSYLSRQTGLSRSAIARSVAKLHALAIIYKVSGGTGRANTYRPAFHAAPAKINSPDTADISVTHETSVTHDSSVTHDTTPVSCVTPDPSHMCDTIPLTPRSISVGEYRGIPADGGAPGNDGFEDFWSSYPKREGRTLAKQAYSRVVAAGIAPDTLIAKARQYAEAKADVDAKWLKMPANWLKEECWLEDPQPPRPRELKPARAAKPVAKRQKPARAAEAVVKKPVVNSARPVVKKPARAKPVANGQTDKGRASLKRELSPPPPKPLAIAEPPKPAPKPATAALGQVPFTTGATADGSKLPRLAIRADAPKPMPPAVSQSSTATTPTEPPKSRPRIGGEAPAKSTGRCRRTLSLDDTSMMLRVFAENRGSVNVERVLQDYFSVEESKDIPAEALAELLTRIGLDEKGIAAIRAELSRAAPPSVKAPLFEVGARVWQAEIGSGIIMGEKDPSPPPVKPAIPPMKAPWFEPGDSVLHEDYDGRVILGSESLADNGGKVLIEFDDHSGEGPGPQLLVDPAELMLRRIWHPKHGLGIFLFEDNDGEVSVIFEDKDGSSHVRAAELSPCVSFDPKSLTDRDGKMVRHPKLGYGVVVGEEKAGKLIIVFDDKDGSRNAAELGTSPPAAAKPVASALEQAEKPFTPGTIAAEAPNPAPVAEPAITSAIAQVAKPFTPGAIAAEPPKPLETKNPRMPATGGKEDAEKPAEREAEIDAIMHMFS